MKHPDKWEPPEPGGPDMGGNGQPEPPGSRRGALAGLILIVLLVVGGLTLAHVLRNMSRFQDCVLSGRAGCG